MIYDTKIDDSFPATNFLIYRFSTPFRSDRDANGGGIMLYAREDILANLFATENLLVVGLYGESNLRNTNWLLNCSYNSNFA